MTENKPHSFVAFALGFFCGAYLLQWGLIIGALVLGFVIGHVVQITP